MVQGQKQEAKNRRMTLSTLEALKASVASKNLNTEKVSFGISLHVLAHNLLRYSCHHGHWLFVFPNIVVPVIAIYLFHTYTEPKLCL